MLLRQIVAPQSEPIDLTMVENQIMRGGIGSLSDESAIIDIYIRSIRQRAEAVTRRSLITQQWELVLDGFPLGRGAITLPLPPLQSVDAITYVDANGATQTLDPLGYRVIQDTPGYVMPLYGLSWPVALNDVASVRIAFTCGYGPLTEGQSDNVPEAIKNWMLLNVAFLYENRESAVIDRNSLVDLSTFADSLLSDFRVRGF